jgi:hypothetical protein
VPIDLPKAAERVLMTTGNWAQQKIR